MHRIELHLTDYARIRLDRFCFYPDVQSPPLITVCSGSSSYCVGGSRNFFLWSVGVRALTLLLLKGVQHGTSKACLSGGAGSPASSLDYALSKQPAWLIDFFGMTSQGNAVAKSFFGRRNSERKRPGPVEVYLNDALVKANQLHVFLNGVRVSKSQIPELVNKLEAESSTVDKGKEASPPPRTPNIPPLDARESSPLAVRSRTIKQFIDQDSHTFTYTLISCFVNISDEPVSFLHTNVFNNGEESPRDLKIESFGESAPRWRIVNNTQTQSRIIVEFDTPIPPGGERTVSVSYHDTDSHDTESYLEHSLRLPCSELHIEVACSRGNHFCHYTLFAEGSERMLFASLPRLKQVVDEQGFSSIRWSMKNPPHGYRYRLLWAIEPQKSKPAQSSPRPQQPPLHEPPVLLT